jgi:hypothetical protein
MADQPSEEKDSESHLSLYLYYAGQTERLVERRAANSRYFLTVNTAFITILGFAFRHELAGQQPAWLAALPLAGIVVCMIWAQLVRSYRVLTGARFKVIKEMERALPAAPYTEEWQLIKADPAYGGYFSIARLEAVVPWVFAVIYAVLLLAFVIAGI